MSEADDKSSVEEKKENPLQSGMNPQATVPEPENNEEAAKPSIVFPIAHQYSA
ncbi:MAG TPA: hypothetical protein VHC71_07230 [Hyphomicrobium sp.]|jgi:hypothetical protein|nr:hypothetical protein [Hyphomicrobium sp.]